MEHRLRLHLTKRAEDGCIPSDRDGSRQGCSSKENDCEACSRCKAELYHSERGLKYSAGRQVVVEGSGSGRHWTTGELC